MATIINNPPSNSQAPPNEGGIGSMLIAIAVIAILIFLFFLYGLPLMRSNGNTRTAPSNDGAMEQNDNPTINVPDKVEVDINKK